MEETEALAAEAQHYVGSDELSREPMSDVVYPILDKRSHATSILSDTHKSSDVQLVALLGTAIYWRSMIQNILPKGSNGLLVVIENPCTDPFTYQINGPDVVYLGVGDKHDTKYNKVSQRKTLIELEGSSGTKNQDAYDHSPLEDNYCVTVVSVYASDTVRATYVTHTSTIFTIAVAGVFVFTIIVFYIYNAMVEFRQRMVLATATRSSAIVSSLFPSAVRDRLYPTAQAEKPKASKLDAFLPETAKGKLQSFLRDGKASTHSGMDAASSPIAELYPETTVLFADIAGFTAWSSVRQPSQVFHLLESVYAAFDEIARRRGVFKVETVGDSYVAVVGLPTPKKQHAVVMALFAHECRSKMNILTKDLEKTLGPVSQSLMNGMFGSSHSHVQLNLTVRRAPLTWPCALV
jgi:Adenylate and Guanylate cyclase catalytic domain